MMRVPLCNVDGKKAIQWGSREEWNPIDFSRIHPTSNRWEFFNLNIETWSHTWNNSRRQRTRTFPFPLPNYILEFRVASYFLHPAGSFLRPGWISALGNGREGGRMSISQDRLRMHDVASVCRSPWGRASSFSKRGHSSQRMSEKIFRVSALFAREGLFCPFSCCLSSWATPHPRFPMQGLGLQASLVLPIAPALGFGAAPKPSRPLNPSHVPFLAPAAWKHPPALCPKPLAACLTTVIFGKEN